MVNKLISISISILYLQPLRWNRWLQNDRDITLIWIRHSLQASIASTHRHVHVQIVVLGSFLHYSWLFFFVLHFDYPINSIAKEIFWAEIYRGRLFFRAEIYRGRLFLGAIQEGLTIVHFVNKLIVSCKEVARVPFYFFFFIFKLDSYFLFKLIGYFQWFLPIAHSMLKLRIHFRLVLIVYIDSSPYTHIAV